jgi:hypothetical protein
MDQYKKNFRKGFGLLALVLVGCGGGGDSAPTVVAPSQASLAQLGVASLVVAGGATPIHLMTGKQEQLSVALVPDSATSAADLEIAFTGKGVLPSTKDSSGVWQLQLDASVMSDGEAVPVQITITNNKLNKYAVADAQLSFVTPVSSGAIVNSAGGVVGPPEFQVQILPNDLVSPVSITVRRAPLSDGTTVLFDVSLDTDIGNSTVSFRLPELPSAATPAQATGKQQTLSARRLATFQTLPEAWKNGALYPGGVTWLDQLGDFYSETRGFRIVIPVQCLRSDNDDTKLCPKNKFAGVRQTAFKLDSIVEKKFAQADWENFQPVLFVHGYNFWSAVANNPFVDELGGGRGTWQNFPALAKSTSLGTTSEKLVPFEFRWNTNASFKIAGQDLATAIHTIHRVTGKKVHIVAHSFGGVLARTVLENVAFLNDGTSAAGEVASLLTLGTPHSGIANSADLPPSAVPIIWQKSWLKVTGSRCLLD